MYSLTKPVEVDRQSLARAGYAQRELRKAKSSPRLLVGACISCTIASLAIAFSPACLHWFLIPLVACGTICCADGLLLFSNKGRNLFEPVPLVGAFGVYFFLVAPILHVASDYWFTSDFWAPKDVPDDWRPWLGIMAGLNFVGLLIYKLAYRPLTRVFLRRESTGFRKVNTTAARSYGVLFCAAVFLLQMYVYYRFGGVQGFIQVFQGINRGRESQFTGLGWLFAIAESFPVLLIIVCSVLFRRHFQTIGYLRLLGYMIATLVLALFFGGLRGSRGNTVYTIAYICGIVHLTVRPINRRVLVLWSSILLLFMYVYSFYKFNPALFYDPASLVSAFGDPESRLHLEAITHRSLEAMFMGDLDRSDMQAYLLFRKVGQGSDSELAYGRTYIEGAVNFIPMAIANYRPPGKLRYGTDAVFGPGTYSPTRFYTKIYGAAGEAMLNFGPYAAPLGFLLLAVCVAYARALSRQILSPADVRRYFIPILSIACVVCISSDLDNVIFVLLQHALVPFVLLRMCSGPASHYVRVPSPTD